MSVYDKAAVLDEVLRILPDVRTVAVTGSAAFEGVCFRPDSDVDVVAVGSRNAFAWGRVDSRELEIRSYTLPYVTRMVQNPQWQTTNWLWFSGRVACAEVLWGQSLEGIVRSHINARTRLIAGSGLIGLLLHAENRFKSGRRPVSLDVPLALTGLRFIVAGVLPIRAEPDEDFSDMSAASDLSGALRFASSLAHEAVEILRDNNEIAKIMYLPEHRTGLRWLRHSIGIDMQMPDVCVWE